MVRSSTILSWRRPAGSFSCATSPTAFPRSARPGPLVLHRDARTKAHAVGRDLRNVDRRELAQPLAEVAEPRLHELLALERGLVLAVLAQVSVLDGFPDLV